MIEQTNEDGIALRRWTIHGGYKIRELIDGSMELTCHESPVCPRAKTPVRETPERLARVAMQDNKIDALIARRDAIEARLEVLCEEQEDLIREAIGGFSETGEEENVLEGNAVGLREAFVLGVVRGAEYRASEGGEEGRATG